MLPSRPEHRSAVPLLEREPELAAAARAVDALCGPAASGGLLIYRGEAGIGKTALLAAVRRLARDRCTVHGAQGGETVASVPFHVVRQLLRPALAGLGEDPARPLLGDGYDVAAPALGLAAPSGPAADPQGVRDGLDRVVARLAERHRSRPLVLLVDDAHGADTESLTWLAALSASLPALPLLVVLAHRAEPVSGSAAALLGRLGAAARLRLTLHPFSPGATAELARATLGDRADDPFCREVWAVTGGNPYETVELLARVQDRFLDPVERSVPRLRDLGASARGSGLVARLEKLGTGPTRLAWAAAVLGAGIPRGLAATLAGMTPAEAAGCTERLREARIVTATDPMEFAHPLIATAIYRSIPPATRTALHGRAAWAVAHAGLGAAAASRHLLEIHPDDDEEVVAQLRRAAREHLAVGAPEAARRCLERALQEPPPPHAYAEVLYELGCAALLTSPPATVRHLRSALALPGLDGDLRTDATCRLAQALAHSDRLGEAARSVATEAARTPPGPARTRLRAAHFMYEAFRATEEDGPGRSRRLAGLADHLPGTDNAERALLSLRAFDAMLRGEDAEHVLDLCDRALVHGRPARGLSWTDTEWGFETPALVGITYAFTDRPGRALDLFEEAVRAFEISGWSGAHLAFAHTLVGLAHRRRGALAVAESFLREGLRLADRVGSGLPVQWDAACLLIDTLLARGRVTEARDVATRYRFGPPWPGAMLMPDGPCVHARLLLAEGRTKEGVAELEAAGRAFEARDRHNGLWAPWACDLARALATEDPTRAARLATRARVQAERFGTDTAIGEALRCAALFARPDEAVHLLAQAVRHLEASPSAYEHARARHEYALALRSPARLAHAAALATACGAESLAARAAADHALMTRDTNPAPE
ncbi:ATP-binding protein [Streptomyces sp. WAC05374]|uniref:ATP-binding protein n=2 Tax=Streptomyces sp. WAC05374 TaxID=2487420 RepID=UPI001054AF5E|nr:AAA family ATPase [Streptomyces sp. WAC05374]TDF45848.1 ATP-binding protein [Streptomyces sp. WAC05374]TDF48142.1 ATP-binding protein [Streptomyces sp. WAC05374]TDF52843.1 ATP-binding protein [Streptomyces sp. WAC05374]